MSPTSPSPQNFWNPHSSCNDPSPLPSLPPSAPSLSLVLEIHTGTKELVLKHEHNLCPSAAQNPSSSLMPSRQKALLGFVACWPLQHSQERFSQTGTNQDIRIPTCSRPLPLRLSPDHLAPFFPWLAAPSGAFSSKFNSSDPHQRTQPYLMPHCNYRDRVMSEVTRLSVVSVCFCSGSPQRALQHTPPGKPSPFLSCLPLMDPLPSTTYCFIPWGH